MTTRGLVLGMLLATAVLGTATAQAAGPRPALAQDVNPFESMATPVGLAAVGFGIAGMVAGVLRRKKVEIQPENQRKS
ncbi:MAG: hypothetical protein IJH84_02660 [Saccharopolyspora sp.]|uniref:hypothetical protein n=1 Tax=Saccharopolyspora TaxID=1835 RepID=UPI001909542B|nr:MULTISPECIES: hypothetical protein [unclassified Saccharopolyspora]MBK0865953.1 hypothetical protein [Saccharopolyspora sp. HNM0986]MBQ6639919.1 hypothetical protein [Saccharopolyspora sp.]